MNYIVIDLEWNQPLAASKQVEGLSFEIIEIGAYKLNEALEMVDSFHRVIKPAHYKKLHRHILQVVSITERELSEGCDFESAGRDFIDWCGDDFCFCSWGTGDVYTLRSNFNYYGIDDGFGSPLFYLDIQKLYSFEFYDSLKRINLKDAIQGLSIDEDQSFHRALSDAYYTCKIMQSLDFDKLKIYKTADLFKIPSNRETEIHVYYDRYYKYISRGFADASAAMLNRKVREACCPCCKGRLSRKINWFKDGMHSYSCFASCTKHGDFVGKIKLRYKADKVFVIKIIKAAKKDSGLKLEQRKELIRLKRKEKRNADRMRGILNKEA